MPRRRTIPRIAIAPIHGIQPSWKPRHSRPCGCSRVPALVSGMEIRPVIFEFCLNSASSLTESAVGFLPLGDCCAKEGAESGARLIAATKVKARIVKPVFTEPFSLFLLRSDRDRFAIRRLPAPSTGAVAAFDHAFLVNSRDDVAVAGKQRFGRAHLRAKRQFPLRQAIRAVFHVFGFREVSLGTARAIGAFVHLAARTEIPDARILRRAERAGVEAITAADA